MDANERYEKLAKQFNRDTGLLAPGKDAPAAVAADPKYKYEYRQEEWDKWLANRRNLRSKEMTRYIDYLQEHMKQLVKRYVNNEADNFPSEFKQIPKYRLVNLLVDSSVPILRKMEDDALRASICSVCSMIRFAEKQRSKEK